MSFSQEVKNELCAISVEKFHCENCAKAFLYGMLLLGRGVNRDTFMLNTESKPTADLFARQILELTGAIVTILHPDLRERTKRPLFSVLVEDQNDIRRIYSAFFLPDNPDKFWIDEKFFGEDCCRLSFLRGAYLVSGAMTDPMKDYHLEFSVASRDLCSELAYFLEEMGLEFRQSTRGKMSILYVKESEQIEDTLLRLGAMKSSFQLMNLKIEKDLRNQVNRVTNCETANIGKTVNAAMEQIQKISLLKDSSVFETLPPQLKEVAELRLQNPESSLRELSELTEVKISRSGLNHRLKKLCEMADVLTGTRREG